MHHNILHSITKKVNSSNIELQVFIDKCMFLSVFTLRGKYRPQNCRHASK